LREAETVQASFSNCSMCSCTFIIPQVKFIGAGMATGYGLNDRGVSFRVPVWSRIFSSP
jgi:hypothetical protein